jgi:uncharacterized membrane protein
LRIRALGGIGVIIALIGFISKSNTSDEVQWSLLGASFLVLAIAWFAIFILDYCYYNKLLLGAVSSTVKLEKNEDATPTITFSSDVKSFIEGEGHKFSNLWPIIAFYAIVFVLLIICCVYSFHRA